jgi:hypothetical protein
MYESAYLHASVTNVNIKIQQRKKYEKEKSFDPWINEM